MSDVARMAGVSIATVSRALNGEPGVSPRTRARVETIARALHYEVDDSARRLRVGRNRTVAIVVARGPECAAPLAQPALMSLVGAIADALADEGFDLVLSRVQTLDCDGLARDFESGRACALALVGQVPAGATLDEMAARGVPFVTAGPPGPQPVGANEGRALVAALLDKLRLPWVPGHATHQEPTHRHCRAT